MHTPPLEMPGKTSPIGMPVELIVDGVDEDTQPITDTHLQTWLSALRQVVDDPRLQQDICVRICSDDESRTLNRTYRGKDAPTNVLSFPAEVEIPDPPLGDLAICWPVVQREAQAQKKAADAHCAHLFIHGVLHLLGHDHMEDSAAADMEACEIRALALLGIGNPYT
jgi:probable rRNA maturation factor